MGGTHKIFADIDVDGEVKGTSLDLNGNAQIDGTVTVGVDDTGYDVKLFGATSGRYMLWDESEDSLRFTDNTKLKLGTGNDFQLYHSGSNSFITNLVGDINIINYTDNQDIKFQTDDGSGDVTTYLQIDGGNEDIDFLKNAHFLDNVNIKVGSASGGDLQIYHNASHSLISNQTGNLFIRNQTDDGDIIFQADDSSGGDATYFTVDGSAHRVYFEKNIRMQDSGQIQLGSGGDLKLYHNATDSVIENEVGDLYIANDANDKDIIFQSDDGSGGMTTYFSLDGSAAVLRMTKDMYIPEYIYHESDDNTKFGFSGADTFKIFTGGAEVIRVNGGSTTDEAAVSILCGGGTNVENIALLLKGDTNGEALKLKIQNPNNSGTLTGAGILSYEPDADTFNIGQSTTHANMAMSIDNSEDVTFISNITVSGKVIATEIEGSSILLDSAADIELNCDGADVILKDATTEFGRFKNDSSDFVIKSAISNKDMIFKGNDGGSTITALKLDMSNAGNAIFNNGLVLADDALIGNDTNDDIITLEASGNALFTYTAQFEDNADFNGKVDIDRRRFAKTSSSDGNAIGDVVYFGGTTSMTIGKIYHYKSNGTWELADADSASTCDGLLGVALGTASDSHGVLLRGMVTIANDPGAVGDVLYVSTSAGQAVATAPSGNGDIVRVVGYCLDASNGQIWFNPDGTFVEVSA